MSTDLGDCDFCQEPIGEQGYMIPTGEWIALEVDGPKYPVHRFYCSQTCLTDARNNDQEPHQ
jgi:hypothetical protein